MLESRKDPRPPTTMIHNTPALALASERTDALAILEAGGRGERNQEAALGALHELRPDELAIFCASDGRDNSEHAGVLVDRLTAERACERGCDPREYHARHDSFTFFHTVGDAIRTGYTGSNVADLTVALKGKRKSGEAE